MLQLSILALSIKLGLITACPLADKYTLTDCFGLAIGAIGSNTTAVVVPICTLPELSVTVNVIVLIPMSAHEMVFGLILTVLIPQLSVLPLLN